LNTGRSTTTRVTLPPGVPGVVGKAVLVVVVVVVDPPVRVRLVLPDAPADDAGVADAPAAAACSNSSAACCIFSIVAPAAVLPRPSRPWRTFCATCGSVATRSDASSESAHVPQPRKARIVVSSTLAASARGMRQRWRSSTVGVSA
jgi:hypothetical protein